MKGNEEASARYEDITLFTGLDIDYLIGCNSFIMNMSHIKSLKCCIEYEHFAHFARHMPTYRQVVGDRSSKQ